MAVGLKLSFNKDQEQNFSAETLYHDLPKKKRNLPLGFFTTS